MILHGWVGLAELERNLGDSKVVLIPSFGKVIAAVDGANAPINIDLVAAFQVFWGVVLLSSERHSWAVGENWLLSELRLLEEHWEGESSTVLGVDFFNLDGFVRQEVVETVELLATIVTGVLPEDFEVKNLAIVIKETLQVLVGATTLQLDFVVVFELSQIRRVLLHVDHGTGMHEGIIWETFWASKINAFVSVVGLGEVITVNNAEDSGVDIKILAKSQI